MHWKRISFLSLAMVLLLNLFPFTVFGAEATAESSATGAAALRLYGKDRTATSLAVSQQGWGASDTVILNELNNYADAIAATPLAVQLDAPVLLTYGAHLDPRVKEELKRLKAKKVILLGGNGRLSTTMEKELTELNYEWERIGGADRYETSALIAERVPSDTMIMVNGDDFPDALSAASYAGIKQIPILLMSNPEFPQTVSDYYQKHKPTQVIVVGGDGVVPEQLVKKQNIPITLRLGGEDRYESAAKLYEYAQGSYGSKQLYLASGQHYPDAMVGTVLAAKNNSALLITKSYTLPESIAPIFAPDKIAAMEIFILGGTGVVSGKIQAGLEGKDFTKNLLIGKTVVVDPGHGSPDPGALGPSGSQEKINNLAIAQYLAVELEAAGAKVVLTRSGDNSPAYSPGTTYTERGDLQKRVDIANENNADLFISIHNDSWKTAQGTTTFYSSENPSGSSSYKLAQYIQSELTQKIGTKNLGVKDSRLYVLRNNTMPAVLVEVAFISHPTEEKQLSDNAFRQKAAQGISQGIQAYIRYLERV
ncbi:cell wall-binding repeat-containing protein [Desulfitobacterium sp. PCE1]|uniref:cell wall-binding repeat-containing protein n=1 Tax=Desulfitobacterium sp. PCE1 TaxID=146907 RepID=UPI0003682C5F|nr:cell wall-binding repeat-containing protein [Desulfitobacterium sp. PCE1]